MPERRKNREIDLYSDSTENKLLVLVFAAIISVWIGVKAGIWLKIFTMIKHGIFLLYCYLRLQYVYQGSFGEEMATILLMSTAS